MTKKKTEPTFPDPPEHLSEKASELYRFYIGLTIRAPGQIALFVKGLEALDQTNEVARIIRKEGLTQTSERSGLKRQHCLLNVQKEAMSCFMRVWKALELNQNKYQDGFSCEDFV
ncbi:MAG: hypothetical protein HQ551_04620 [Desulfobacteraceae bacterium]|nr:hypothetical protein [Desulfobacteraceae bacterium]